MKKIYLFVILFACCTLGSMAQLKVESDGRTVFGNRPSYEEFYIKDDNNANYGMQDAATAFMQADIDLYNSAHLCQIHECFDRRGLIGSNNHIVTTDFINQTVDTGTTTVISCSDLHVEDVSVINGATLKLEAPDTVTITSGFEVQLGSKLEIK